MRHSYWFRRTPLFLIQILAIILILSTLAPAAHYPDQQYILEGADSLLFNADTTDIIPTQDGKGIQLKNDALNGSIILRAQSSDFPFDIGLPSWNGTAPGDAGGFRVFVRVPSSGGGWTPWLEVGYWKANLWSGDKNTSCNDGYINIDTGIFYDFKSQWQFKVEMKRNSTDVESPTLGLISFTASDERTTDQVNLTAIYNDNPDPIYIDTQHIWQYSVDDQIGGRICSPTSASMVLRSYDIPVDPYQFALDNLDPYYDIFGVWPRTVENASEHGLRGTVNRYRTWSETRPILESGGRVVMSVGSPLYPNGHLIMLAGFNDNGWPIVHDPARSDGYAYIHNKAQLSESWFNKGGVAYTFYLRDTSAVSTEIASESAPIGQFSLAQNYPNPFNGSTNFYYTVPKQSHVSLTIYNLRGELVTQIVDQPQSAGEYTLQWNGIDQQNRSLASGEYIYTLSMDRQIKHSGKLILLK